MIKKSLLILFAFVLVFTTLPIQHENANADNSNTNSYYLKLTYNDFVIYHEKVIEGKYIQIYDKDNNIVDSTVLKEDLNIKLEGKKVPGKILSYWDIKDDEQRLKIIPIYIDSNDINITFKALDGGYLIKNNAQTTLLTKSVKKGTLLNDILPSTNGDKNFKLSGFYIFENKEYKEIEQTRVYEDAVFYALFYPDINDNNIDDRTEKVTVNFVTNSKQKINPISLYVGEKLNIPALKTRKNYIFMGWYTDKNFEIKFEDSKITEDLTLYAKWTEAEKVIEENKEKVITNEDLSKQIESYLNKHLKNSTKDNKNSKQQTSNQKNNSSNLDKNSNNNSIIDNSNDTNNANNENEILYSSTKYVFKNTNADKTFLFKAYNKDDNSFLFSILAPYGQSIKIQSENGVIKEYAVRQNTTVYLNLKDFVKDAKSFLEFDSKSEIKNNVIETVVYPKFSEYKNTAIPRIDNTDDNNNHVFSIVIGLVLLAILIVIFVIYFIKKKSKERGNVL